MINNIIFMGTPEFAVPSLEALIQADYRPILVISQPDKPKGRNQKIEPTPIIKCARKYTIPTFQPEDVNHILSTVYIKSFSPDIIITVAYGGFLGAELRNMCPFGAINMHPSLLPRHRGADPIRSTILQGDEHGVSVFFITKKMDSGPIIVQEKFEEIDNKSNMTYYEEKLSAFGSTVLIKAIEILLWKKERFSTLRKLFPPQDHEKATYSVKVDKDSNKANFDLSPEDFIRHVRAYAYEPGYYCMFRGKRLKVFEAESRVGSGELGVGRITQIIKNEGFVISLPKGDILIKEVQFEGKKRMSAWDFHLGARIEIGERIEN